MVTWYIYRQKDQSWNEKYCIVGKCGGKFKFFD